ncbi:MAG: S8 family peptidase [Bacteroidetes bacterium]|nr:S8 family peptidase [Bacteroidota bacterium]
MKFTPFKLTIFFCIQFFLVSTSYSQLSKNWYNEDPDKDRFAGVSSDVTYESLLKDRKSTTVIVAVIDGGTEVDHPDLADNIWVNEDEIADNGIDDDKNGYVDDVHGWNFIGGKNGDVGPDNVESTRIYKKYKPLFEGKSTSGLTAEQKLQYALYKKAKASMEKDLKQAQEGLKSYEPFKKQLDDLKLAMGKENFTGEDVEKYQTTDKDMQKLLPSIVSAMKGGVTFEEIYKPFNDGYKQFYSQVNYHLNPEFESRQIVGDNYEDYTNKYYGNNQLEGPDGDHGTHVAGIIGAIRNNNIGMKGIANDVKIMVVRVVPDGDERDKDVANAIRYAADNGAKVINMSFGKNFSPSRKYVEEAIKYAADKDVVMVHGAGNDGANLDKGGNFPTPYYEATNKRETAWIEVGAISSSGDVAYFSNYGAKTVDVLAPGVSIYSTVPDGKYDFHDGTSMAAPVVAGMAAMIRSYFPSLSASQVRTIIMNSSIKMPIKTKKPGSKKKVKYTKLCVSGGIVNAYRAVKVAEEVSGK